MHRNIRRWFIGLVAIGIVAAITYVGHAEYQRHVGRQAIAEIKFESLPFAAAVERAKAESRPVLVEVYALWCPTCLALHRQVWPDAAISSYVRENFVFSMVDFDLPETKAFMEEHGGRGTPSLWVMDARTNEFFPLSVTLDPEAFLEQLRRHTNK